MWFDLDPDEPDVIRLNTKPERLKYRQLQRDPNVSLLFENGMNWTAMRGTVTLDATFQPALDHIKGLARRYGSDPARFEGQERVIIRLKVDKVIRHDGSAIHVRPEKVAPGPEWTASRLPGCIAAVVQSMGGNASGFTGGRSRSCR